MKINTNSWYYQLADLDDNTITMPKTLCGYFWKVVFGIMMVVVGLAMVVFLLYQFIKGNVLIFGSLSHGLRLSFDTWIAWLFNILIFVIVAVKIVHTLLKKKKKKSAFWKVIIAYIIAKKKKICPNIEYV